jgi:hypothetical protein
LENITLDYAEAYLLDRIKELRHQVPHGNPFVFLGAFTLLELLTRGLGDGSDVASTYLTFCGKELPPEAEKALRNSLVFHSPLTTFSLNCPEDKFKLNLTHEEENHLSVEETERGVKVTIAANSFLDDMENVIKNIFSSAKSLPVREARLFVYLNENRPIGLVP